MKSRTSFFNKTIYKKNLTLYWPIWVCYLLYGLCKVPGILWFELQSYGDTQGAAFMALSECLNLKLDILMIAVMSVISGMALFSYLFSAKSAYMIHALPVTRTELFFTNMASGLSFLIVPQVLVFIVTVLFALQNGIACVQYVGVWLLSVMGISCILFSIACLCAILTGLVFAVPVFFLIANYLAAGCTMGVRLFFSLKGYGISFNDTPDIFLLRILSPIEYMMSRVKMSSTNHYDSQGLLVANGLSYSGGGIVLGYAVASVFVFAIAYCCYRKRKSESAGDLLAFSWLKPVFRWGAGICAGYLAGIMLSSVFTKFPIWVALLVFGLVAYFVADMFVQKSFRVFTKRRIKESVAFLGFVVASYAGMYGATYAVVHYVPDESQLSEAYLYMNYPVEFTGGQISEAIQVQEEILSRSSQLQEMAETEVSEDIITISFIYHFKNGKKLERLYQLPDEDAFCVGLTETLYNYEMEPDSFMRYLIGSDYADIQDFEEAAIEYESEDGSYISHMLEPEEAVAVYRALCADAEEGTLQKYNLRNFFTPDPDMSEEEPSVYLYFSFSHTTEDWKDAFDVASGSLLSDSLGGYASEEDNLAGYLNVAFGEDCTNIIEALVEAGVIGSPDDLVFTLAE